MFTTGATGATGAGGRIQRTHATPIVDRLSSRGTYLDAVRHSHRSGTPFSTPVIPSESND
jgi:hypothetical protein